MTIIMVFGDSIAYGASDKEGGWAARLRKFLESEVNEEITLYNLGICGDRTDDVKRRLEIETKWRLDDEETDYIFVFAVGINDSQFVMSSNEFRTPLETFKENLKQIIRYAKKISEKIIFIGLNSVDESKTSPCLWNKDKFYQNKHIKLFDLAIKDISKQNSVSFIEVFDIFNNKKDLLSEDGLHPGLKGHEKIFQAVKEFLINNEMIKT